jgi:WD40 repeat protein
MNTPDDDLTRSLEQEAAQFARRGGTALDISQVLDRAGEIRRGRRMRATMVMAACVLAIAVPTVLVAANRDTTHEPTPAPAPRVDTSPLTLGDLPQGPAPRGGYATAHEWHPSSGHAERFASQGPATGVARVGSGYVVALSDDRGNPAAEVVAPRTGSVPGTARTIYGLSGGIAVSEGGHVAAFVKPDGTPVVVQDDGRTTYTMPKIPRGSGFGAVAVTGEDCKETASNPGCTVWVNSSGRRPDAWVSTSHGFADRASSRLQRVADVVAGHVVAGITKVTDEGSCSEVEATDSEAPLWTTCEHRLLSFSPDGSRLLASAAYADGLGDTELTVLDSATGTPLLDLRTTDQAAITQMAWEDDSHVLATIFEQNRWAVLRIGLDGKREYAVPPVAGDDSSLRLVLPSS